MWSCRTAPYRMMQQTRALALTAMALGLLVGFPGKDRALAASDIALHIPSQKVVLPTGLTVVVSEKSKLPIAQISVRVRVGSVHDPEHQAGLADLTARLLDKGTAQRTALEIAEEIDFLGARLESSAGGTGSTVSLAVLAKDVERGLDLLTDVLRQPRFDPAELERERARMLSEIRQRRVNPRQVVAETFRELAYAGHPLHRPTSGYPETLPAITRDDISAFHQHFYVPNNTIAVMVADLPAERMISLLEQYFGEWPARPFEQAELPQPSALTEKRVQIVDMDVNQTSVQFGHLGVRRADPEFPTIRAMNYILGGGGFRSRLTQSIREEQGLAYAVHSYFVGGSQFPGFFVAELQTRIDTTSQALTSLFGVIEGMKQAPVSTDELRDMKLFFEGSLPRRAETYGQVAGLLLDREFFGLPDGYWEQEIHQIQALTPEDIQQAAQRHLQTESFVLALVTKREQLLLSVPQIPQEALTYAPAP